MCKIPFIINAYLLSFFLILCPGLAIDGTPLPPPLALKCHVLDYCKQEYTVRINSPWNFRLGPPLERHLKIDKRWTGSHKCTLLQIGAKKKIVHISSRPELYYMAYCSCGTANQQVGGRKQLPPYPYPQWSQKLKR